MNETVIESGHQLDAHRPLSRFELGWAALRYYFSGIFQGEGSLDREVLRQALITLTAKYPFLNARVVLGEQGFEFVLPTDPVEPILTFEEGDIDAPLSKEQGSLPDGRVAGARVIVDGDRFKFAFVAHHSGIDGRLVMQYGFELFAYYTGLMQGAGFEGGSFPGLPASPEGVLEEYGVPAIESSEYLRKSLGEEAAAQVLSHPARPQQAQPAAEEDAEPPQLVLAKLYLDEAQVQAIKDRAKRAGVTVHAVIGAATVLAEFLLDENAAQRFIILRTAVDARSRTVPPVGNPASVTNFAGASIALFPAQRDEDPVIWANQILNQMNVDLNEGLVPASVRLLPELLGALQRVQFENGPEVGRISISNVGVMPTLPMPEGVLVKAVDGHVQADPIPGLIPRSGRTSGTERNYSAVTYGGRLRMNVFLLDRPQAEADRLIAALERAFEVLAADGK